MESKNSLEFVYSLKNTICCEYNKKNELKYNESFKFHLFCKIYILNNQLPTKTFYYEEIDRNMFFFTEHRNVSSAIYHCGRNL